MSIIIEQDFEGTLKIAQAIAISFADLEKVVNLPQAENSKLYNFLKIAWFATNYEQKYVYQMLVWHYQILKSWVPILNS